MPSVRAREFQSVFTRAFADGARLSTDDVQALEKAARKLTEPREKRAATDLLKLVKDDRALDATEVEPARKALCRLLGTSSRGLPKALEALLEHAVPVPNVRVKSYDLEFDFSKDAESFPARARITLDEPAPDPAILEVDPERLAIDEVRVGGRTVPFRVKDGRIFVDAPGARELDVRYHVTPTEDPHGYGLIRDRYAGRMWTLTWPYSTGALFPSNSHPNDGATASVRVRVAKGTSVVAAGKRAKDGAFKLPEPVPAYSVAFYAGEFTDQKKTRRGGVDVVTQGLGKKMSDAARKETREAVAHTVAFLSKWLGPYPFGDRLNVVEVDHAYGGMEHAGAIAVTVGDKAEHLEAAVHEAVHHWFGATVRIEARGEYWMSEGFTQYATFRAFEDLRGTRELYTMLDDARDRVESQLDDAPTPLSSTDPASAYDDFFSDVAYYQGPWMLRMLESRFGRARFDGLLRDWYREKKGQAVTTKDFVDFLRVKTGEDLAGFFQSWNALTALPSFRDESTFTGSKVKVHLMKRAPIPDGLKIPLVVSGAGGQMETFLVDPKTRPVLEVPFEVRRIDWDPDRTVLCRVR
jgi:aminopeptidase N